MIVDDSSNSPKNFGSAARRRSSPAAVAEGGIHIAATRSVPSTASGIVENRFITSPFASACFPSFLLLGFRPGGAIIRTELGGRARRPRRVQVPQDLLRPAPDVSVGVAGGFLRGGARLGAL